MLLHEIFEAVRQKPRRGFPTLIGPTQWGKTHAINSYGVKSQLPVVTINPQTETEEEFGGFPLKHRTTDEVRYSFPPALSTMYTKLKIRGTDPHILFIDEMDKARNDVLSCLLTLTSPLERRLRHFDLTKDVLLIGAMNEPMRALPDPFLARMLMLPFPYDFGEYIQTLPQSSRSSVKKLYKMPSIKFPQRPSSPGSMLTLIEWFDLPTFWENEALQTLVIRGLFPETMVAGVKEDITSEKPRTDPVNWMKRATPQAVLKGLIQVLDQQKPEVMRDVLQAFLDRAQADPTGEIGRLYETFTSEKKPEPHSCVQFNIELKDGRWTRDIGQDVWTQEYKQAVKAK